MRVLSHRDHVDGGIRRHLLQNRAGQDLQLSVYLVRLGKHKLRLSPKAQELADGSVGFYDVVGPVEVRFSNRQTSVEALVIPGTTKTLLGAIPNGGNGCPNRSQTRAIAC